MLSPWGRRSPAVCWPIQDQYASMRAPSRSGAGISWKAGSMRVGTCRSCRARSIVCWVRSRRVPTARSTWRPTSCAPRARACVRPRAVSATGWDGLVLSTLAAFAADSACRAKTNKRSMSAGIAGLLPLVREASGGHLGLGGWCTATGARDLGQQLRVAVQLVRGVLLGDLAGHGVRRRLGPHGHVLGHRGGLLEAGFGHPRDAGQAVAGAF